MGFKRWGWVLIVGALLCAWLGSLVLLPRDGIFVSPDETANAYFATLFAENGQLYSFDSLNVVLDDTLFPRSTVSIDGRLVPQGFIGLPLLYGAFTAVFGAWTLFLVTAMLGALAVGAWYGIVKRLFDQHIALLSAILLTFHPAWWYYSARFLMPNVPFVSFILMAAWMVIVRPWREMVQKKAGAWPKWVADFDLMMGGILLGAGLMIRPAEVIWIGLLLMVIGILYRSHIIWRDVIVIACCALLVLLPLPFFHRSLYGSPVVTGYTIREEEPDTGEEEVDVITPVPAPTTLNQSPAWLKFQELISPVLPFGFHPRNALRHVWWYGVSLFWWLSVLALLGVVFVWPARGLPREQKRMREAYLAGSVAVAGWLAVMYGSWVFHDNPDPSSVSIANSYVRYWLPVFILTTPLIALALRSIATRALTPFAQTLGLVCLVLACVALNVRAVFFAPHDGLVEAATVMERSAHIRDRVLELTESEAVIIVDRADKLFFPHRRVRYPLRDENTYELMPRLVLHAPLYYYGITFPPQDIDYLNGQKLKALGLQIEHIETFDAESLYRIIPLK